MNDMEVSTRFSIVPVNMTFNGLIMHATIKSVKVSEVGNAGNG